MARAWWILAGLAAGLALGAVGDWAAWPAMASAVKSAEAVGGLWLDALKMTIVPLVFALIVSGIISTTNAAAAGRITGRSILLFVILLPAGAAFSALVTPPLLALWPIPAQSAAALIAATPAADAIPGAAAGPFEFIRAFIAPNVVAAAADGAMLALAIFALIFGFAVTRIEAARQISLRTVFEAIAEAMLVIVGWVLLVAPLGVFALAFVVGAETGFDSLGAFAHYIAVVSAVLILTTLLAYPLARLGGGMRLAAFARAMIPAQSVAISTQSSLASLPAMIDAARGPLALPPRIVGITLPLAVSLFRFTSPAGNMAVAIYIASLHGIDLSFWQLSAGVIVAAIVSVAAVGIASAVTFFALMAPICLAMGVPIEVLALLIAVETIPDIFRTIGNVTADVAVTTAVARRSAAELPFTLEATPH
jgi:Na+/H+-dicarboxylate symporter